MVGMCVPYKSCACTAFAALHMSQQHRHWCFTSFDLTLEATLPVLAAAEDGTAPVYLCYQRETAPDTGREHLQGYVEFDTRIGMRTVKQRLGDVACHLEPRKGVPVLWSLFLLEA